MTHAVRQSYDQLAEIYDSRWQRYIEASVRLAAEAIQFEGQERLLDVACGTGALERRLLDGWPRLQITGVDLSPNMLREARTNRLPARWLAADASSLPLADASFDVVACVSGFHYFRQPPATLGEMRRVLRPGGRLVLVDWCDDYLSCKLCSAWLRWTDPAFYKTYSLADCQTELRRAAFEIVSASRHRIGWLWGMMRVVARRDSD